MIETQTLEDTVKPQGFDQLPLTQQDYFTELDQYQAPFLEEKLLLTGEIDAPETYQMAFLEFKKFVALTRLSGGPLGMISSRVDAVWHQFILFTREYHSFSERFYGRYFHHTPYLPSRPGNSTHDHDFIRLYNNIYGPLPEIWRNENGIQKFS